MLILSCAIKLANLFINASEECIEVLHFIQDVSKQQLKYLAGKHLVCLWRFCSYEYQICCSQKIKGEAAEPRQHTISNHDGKKCD